MIVCAKHQRRYKPEGVCPACNEDSKPELECEEGHVCTSGCQKHFDCPCQSDHCCSMSEETCGEVEECEFCASKVPDLADKVNDDLLDK